MGQRAFLDGDVPVGILHGPAVLIVDGGVAFLAKKSQYVLGIGCKRGVVAGEIISSVNEALERCSISREELFACASSRKKMTERGLLDAIEQLSLPLVFVDDDVINSQQIRSPSRANMIGLKGVAEPAALALSKKGELVMKKTVFGRVTIAIAC